MVDVQHWLATTLTGYKIDRPRPWPATAVTGYNLDRLRPWPAATVTVYDLDRQTTLTGYDLDRLRPWPATTLTDCNSRPRTTIKWIRFKSDINLFLLLLTIMADISKYTDTSIMDESIEEYEYHEYELLLARVISELILNRRMCSCVLARATWYLRAF